MPGTTLLFYHDAALTQPITAFNPALTLQKADGSYPAIPKQVWLGSVAAGVKFVDSASPGVGHIMLTPTDTVPGSGLPATSMKLAYTSGGLATAVAGDPLDAGVEILSGVGNAFSFWMLQEDTTGVVGNYTDVPVTTQTLDEVPV